MTDFLTNADHWRRRAEQTRALAANAVKDQGRLLKVAEEYDRLAAHAEGRRNAVPTEQGPSLQGPFLLKGHFRSGKWRAPPARRAGSRHSAAYAA